jgi:hypothetical protein
MSRALRGFCLALAGTILAGAADAHATLLQGNLTGVITGSGWGGSIPTDQPTPFNLDPVAGANDGLPVAVRFWLDTDLVPANQTDAGVYFEETNPVAAWLRVEVEVNGVVEPIDANYLLFAKVAYSDIPGACLSFTSTRNDTSGGS